jgi:hypothetical protein
MVALVKLVASCEDFAGYITYVFECLEDYMISQTKYILCIRFPNWEHSTLNINDIGYLQYEEIRAGVDKWFNGKEMVPYRYNTIQFIKFVNKPKEENHEYIM